MAMVTGFMYCDTIKPLPNGNSIDHQINKPLPMIMAKAFPTEKSFSIALCIDGIDAKSHTMKILFKKTDGGKEIDIGECQIPENAVSNGLFLSIDIRNMVLEEEGEYCTQVIFDEQMLGTYPIKIILSEQ